MSRTIFYTEEIIYKPDFIKIDEEIVVDKLINCKDNCFHSFKFDCKCDVNLRILGTKKYLIKKFEMMHYLKNLEKWYQFTRKVWDLLK